MGFLLHRKRACTVSCEQRSSSQRVSVTRLSVAPFETTRPRRNSAWSARFARVFFAVYLNSPLRSRNTHYSNDSIIRLFHMNNYGFFFSRTKRSPNRFDDTVRFFFFFLISSTSVGFCTLIKKHFSRSIVTHARAKRMFSFSHLIFGSAIPKLSVLYILKRHRIPFLSHNYGNHRQPDTVRYQNFTNRYDKRNLFYFDN